MDAPMLGYAAAMLMGTVLGMLGGGGSVLTLPILVYLFRVQPVLASSYSLCVVGLVALVGCIPYVQSRLVRFRTAIVFGAPSVIGVFLSRRYLLPNIPESMGSVAGIELTRDLVVLVLFAALMLAAGVAMIRQPARSDTDAPESPGDSPTMWGAVVVAVEGLVVGILTGLVGAGGGFLIVPALVLLLRLPIRVAIGTSLAIIAAKSLIGFAADTNLWPSVDWKFLAQFTAAALAGMIIGVLLNRRVPTGRLRVGFGWFVLVLGCLILTKELLV